MRAPRPGWPSSLRSRLFLILLAGLLGAQLLSFAITSVERDQSARAVMLTTLQRDVAVAVALLDRLPAAERPDWLPLLDRRTYRFVLGPGSPGSAALSSRLTMIADEIRAALDPRFPVRFDAVPGTPERLQGHVALGDGSALTIAVEPALRPVASWLPVALAVQVLVLIGCVWIAVRLVVRPLTRFARTADTLEPGRPATPFAETGPDEVARAARALNAMQERVSRHLDERVRILAAISHDLQTPITRMRLRVETGAEGAEQDRLLADLEAIEALVREGIAYAAACTARSSRRRASISAPSSRASSSTTRIPGATSRSPPCRRSRSRHARKPAADPDQSDRQRNQICRPGGARPASRRRPDQHLGPGPGARHPRGPARRRPAPLRPAGGVAQPRDRRHRSRPRDRRAAHLRDRRAAHAEEPSRRRPGGRRHPVLTPVFCRWTINQPDLSARLSSASHRVIRSARRKASSWLTTRRAPS